LDAEIIVVDNASSDDSCAMMQRLFPEVLLIQNTENVGFTKGNNIGVAQAQGEFICILNPDTVVAEDTFSKLVAFAQNKSQLGMVGCQLIDGSGQFLPESKPKDDHGQRLTMLGNYLIILGNHKIYLDLLCFMLSALAFFTYLTSVSFVYITYYGVSETLFGVLFACSAGALILVNYINVRVVSHVGPRRMMHIGLALGIAFSFLLLATTLLELGFILTVASFVCIVGSLGIAAVNADALILIEFPRQASSASAVTGTLRFGCGALAGPILAWCYDGTPLPVAILLLCALLGAGLMQVLRKILHPTN
jgi:DHA1 family bicyclomycin/chloramphenicol resistance-like MFS transporter